jgi:hypothetical protein
MLHYCHYERWPARNRGSFMMVRVFRFLTGTIAVLALVVQFWLMTKYPSSQSISVTIVNFLSFFTIQTNVLIVLCMLAPAVTPTSRVGQLLSGPAIRIAVVSYSVVVGIIYFALLRNIGHDYGLERLADRILHYITPTMFVIDWLAWVPKGRVSWTAALRSLIFPALYGALTLIHGAVTGWYPYPFLNPTRHGYAEMFGNFGGLACFVIAIPFVFVILDRLLAALQRKPD